RIAVSSKKCTSDAEKHFAPTCSKKNRRRSMKSRPTMRPAPGACRTRRAEGVITHDEMVSHTLGDGALPGLHDRGFTRALRQPLAGESRGPMGQRWPCRCSGEGDRGGGSQRTKAGNAG